jgi:hypothetical protein
MKVNQLPGNVIYIEDAFPLHKEFLEALEANNNNDAIKDIIPPWEDWMDGELVDGVWTPKHHRGYLKQVNWDYTINNKNELWPRVEIGIDHTIDHAESYKILKMIDEPYQKALDIWCEITGNSKMEWVTKNYTIKKYKTGEGIVSHTDRDHDHDKNTMDWTALIYLNDDYTGGDLRFDNLGYSISPEAGSIVFFSSDEYHSAEQVFAGNKCFIFLYIQSEYSFSHSIGEASCPMVEKIKLSRV